MWLSITVSYWSAAGPLIGLYKRGNIFEISLFHLILNPKKAWVFKKKPQNLKRFTAQKGLKQKNFEKKAMPPTSGSILSNNITLSSQKVVYIHHFKVMAKAAQKWVVKNLIARPL